MPFDSVRKGASAPDAIRCIRCRKPIREGEPVERVEFSREQFGGKALSGPCHRKCARPFSGAAHLSKLRALSGD